VLGGGLALLDPYATARVLLGTLTLRNDLPDGTAEGDIDYHIECPAGCEVDQTDYRLAPGAQVAVAVYTTLVLSAILSVSVLTNYVRGGTERAFPIQWQNLTGASRALSLLQIISASVFAILWYTNAFLVASGVLTNNSNPSVPRRIPALAQDVLLFGAVIGLLTLLELEGLFGAGALDGEAFPPGDGPNGLTIAANPSAPLVAGEYVTFWLTVGEDIPVASQDRLLQYAFVCDSDTNPANNYVPSPAFPDDFFAGTDRWYELNYAPGPGWTFRCRVVGAGNSITTVPSGARAILSGDTLLVIVPRSEFVVSNPPFRATTFAHSGDFGQNPPYDWSGDPTPTVAEGLQTWQ
jgi:hypothetical protein